MFLPTSGFIVFKTILAIGSLVVGQIQLGISIMDSSSYSTGGFHTPQYVYSVFKAGTDTIKGGGLGYFHEAPDRHYDLPDLYFINTPYISGQISWRYSESDGKLQHFVMQQNTGSTAPGQSAVDIVYNTETRVFKIVLNDGTKLIFGKNDRMPNASKVKGSRMADASHDISYTMTMLQQKSMPSTWWLTEILFNDYVDGDGDENPLTNAQMDKGSYIAFSYDSIAGDDIAKFTPIMQADPFSAVTLVTGWGGLKCWSKDWCLNGPITPVPCSCSVAIGLDSNKTVLWHLREIKTPNETSRFDYTFDRLDDVWHRYQCNLTPLNCSVDSVGRINGPVLRHIEVLSKKGTPVRKVDFTLDYSLRKHCATSEEAEGGTLTLRRIDIRPSNGPSSMPIIFEYDSINKNPNGWQCNRESWPFYGPHNVDGEHHFFIEERDIWGYYCPNNFIAKPNVNDPSTWYYYNDFNTVGDSARALESDAWSLKGVHFPDGMVINWDYEPNRYKRINNANPAIVFNVIKYGGGIRVKKLTVNSGVGKTYSKSYLYTTNDGEFVETASNCSGHATAEPFAAYHDTSDQMDPRILCGRGGLYISAQVLYEKVQVVDNYNPSAMPHAPIGYTVTEFTTSKDYPNQGLYGQIDMGWKRGLVKSITTYASDKDGTKKQITKAENRYSFVEHELPFENHKTIINPASQLLTWGTVKSSSTTTTSNMVTAIKTFKYAEDLMGGQDLVQEPNVPVRGYVFPTPVHYNYIVGDSIYFLPLFYTCFKKVLPGFGSDTIPDLLVFTWTNYLVGLTPYIHVWISAVIDVDDTKPGFRSYAPIKPKKIWEAVLADQNSVNPQIKINNFDNDTRMDAVIQVVAKDPREVFFKNFRVNANNEFDCDIDYNIPSVSSWDVYQIDTLNNYCTNRNNFYIDQDMISIEKGTLRDDWDGQPNQIIEQASNGRMRVTIPKPAYYDVAYSSMKNKHMLTQVCQSATYDVPQGTALPVSPENFTKKVVSASATKWTNKIGADTSVWLPDTSYSWNVKMNTLGRPDTSKTFSDFSHLAGAANQNWQLAGMNEKYGQFSNVIQSADPFKKHTTTVFRNDVALPIARIANAGFAECGVYTCDYDLNEDGAWFDKANGWEKCGAVFAPTVNHFGQGCVRAVDCFGPSRNFKIEKDKDYVASAWVGCATSSGNKAVICADYRSAAASKHFQFPYDSINTYGGRAATITGMAQSSAATWKKLEILIHAKDDLANEDWTTNEWFIRLFVGTKDNDGNHGTAYIDDIRFYPANAQAATTYYDTLFFQPIVSVDANSKPGARVTYDGFGRPVTWHRYDPYNHGTLLLSKQKSYHLMGQQ